MSDVPTGGFKRLLKLPRKWCLLMAHGGNPARIDYLRRSSRERFDRRPDAYVFDPMGLPFEIGRVDSVRFVRTLHKNTLITGETMNEDTEKWHVWTWATDDLAIVVTGDTFAVMREASGTFEMIRAGFSSHQDALGYGLELAEAERINDAKAVIGMLGFLDELNELTRKHGVSISGCGCCGSPELDTLKGDEREGAYEVSDGWRRLRWVPKP